MQFLNPIWLWGLTGMLMPIGIHLLSLKEGKIIYIGSIRHLEETNTRHFRTIRFTELLLLSLRCILITLLVLLLSGLTFYSSPSKDLNWLLIEKGIESENRFKPLIDSLEKKGFELRWLAKDFPLFKDSSMINATLNYWSLAESMKTQQAKQIVVLSYNYSNHFKGKRASIADNVQWISKNPAPVDFTLTAIRLSRDSVIVRKGLSTSDGTRFHNEYRNTYTVLPVIVEDNEMPIQSQDTISITLYNDPQFEFDKEIIFAALKSINESMPYLLQIKTSPVEKWKVDDKEDWIIWLSEKEIPEPSSLNRIVYSKNEFETNELLTLSKSGWVIPKKLDEGSAINKNLTLQLAEILLPINEAQQRVKEFDKRVLPEKLLWSSLSSQGEDISRVTENSNNIESYILFIILFTLLLERIIAYKRNQ